MAARELVENQEKKTNQITLTLRQRFSWKFCQLFRCNLRIGKSIDLRDD